MKRLLLVALLGLALVGLMGTAQAVPPAACAPTDPNYEILGVVSVGGNATVNVVHYHCDGTVWFYENYVFQGKEGNKFEIAVNGLGQKLLADGTVAPTKLLDDGVTLAQYRPDGVAWKYTTDTLLQQDSVISIIESIHRQRANSGYSKQSTNPGLPKLDGGGDAEGADHLVAVLHQLVNYLHQPAAAAAPAATEVVAEDAAPAPIPPATPPLEVISLEQLAPVAPAAPEPAPSASSSPTPEPTPAPAPPVANVGVVKATTEAAGSTYTPDPIEEEPHVCAEPCNVTASKNINGIVQVVIKDRNIGIGTGASSATTVANVLSMFGVSQADIDEALAQVGLQ